MTALGKLSPDPIGYILQTPYCRFQSPLGVDGLVWPRYPRVDFLFIGTSHPGTGQFRSFITQCKAEFDTICIWQIFNSLFHTILPRYGFQPATDFQMNETQTGYRWDK